MNTIKKFGTCQLLLYITIVHLLNFAFSSCILSLSPTLKNAGDNGFKLTIEDAEEGFIPNQSYTVSLSGVENQLYSLWFQQFQIVAAETNTGLAAGSFEVSNVNDGFYIPPGCKHVIRSTDDSKKMSVSVNWRAPSSSTQCISLSASVSISPTSWFANDGTLTATICRAAEKMTAKECCACGGASYDITFKGLWSKETHPKDWPPDTLVHWGNVAGAVHASNYTIWELGGYATEGVKNMALYGMSSILEEEIANHSAYGGIRNIILLDGLWTTRLNEQTSGTFSASKYHSFISIVSMFGPSPDWISGISKLNLCLSNCTWLKEYEEFLYPFDAGVDNGVTYMSNKVPTVPQERIKKITNTYPSFPQSPFYHPGKPINPLAKVTISLKTLHGAQCPNGKKDPRIHTAENDDVPGIDLSKPQSREMRTKSKTTKFRDGKRYVIHFIDDVKDVNCKLTEWSEWSACSSECGPGIQVRTRNYINPKHAKQSNCAERLEDKSLCTDDRTCKPDKQSTTNKRCLTTEWSEWSPCTAECGIGHRERTRKFIDESTSAGCKDSLREKQTCVGASNSCSQGLKMDMFEKKRICMQPKAVGKCKKTETRYMLDFNLRKCVEFKYSGCDGNENNFKTIEECENTCDILLLGQTSSGIDARCVTLPWSEWSPCNVDCGKGNRTRFRQYKSKPLALGFCGENLQEVQECEGHCNENSFHSISKLIHLNENAKKEICMEPVDSGPCESYTDRYYFDVTTERCIPFKYGGCRGKRNNFYSLSDCEMICNSTVKELTKEKITDSRCLLYPWTAWSECSGARCGEKSLRFRNRRYFYPDAHLHCTYSLFETEPCTVECSPQEKKSAYEEKPCCPCGTKTFQITLRNLWSNVEHALNWSNNVHYDWSDILGLVHSEQLYTWKAGELANKEVKYLAEWGGIAPLLDASYEKQKNSNSVFQIFDLTSMRVSDDSSTVSWMITATHLHHFLSFIISMMPSPDWFSGLSHVDLCATNCSWINTKTFDLYPHDAGTDDAKYYTDPKVPRSTPNPVRVVDGSNKEDAALPFYNIATKKVKPVAELTIMAVPSASHTSCDVPRIYQEDLACLTTSWSGWSQCSAKCGYGFKTRSREYENVVGAASQRCNKRLREKESCIENICDGNEMCDVTEWSSWSPCSSLCGIGTTVRTRKFLSMNANVTSKQCDVPLEERRQCQGESENCMDKKVSSQERKRICALDLNDGKPCRSDLLRYYYNQTIGECLPFRFGGCRGNENNFLTKADCEEFCSNSKPRNGVCTWSEWGPWGPCSVTCGKGLTERFRTQTQTGMNSKPCKGQFRMRKQCVMPDCVPVDCQLSPWNEWLECRGKCGTTGLQSRYRTVVQYPMNNGKECDPIKESRYCNVTAC